MMDEMMVQVDPKCIPDGWEPLRFGIPKEGEFIIPSTHCGGGVPVPVQPKERFSAPNLIVRKKYNSGIRLPSGWSIWNYHQNWVASIKVGDYTNAITGLQHFPDFVPPPDGQPRQIN